MENHSFPIPDLMVNMILGEHTEVFEENMVVFTQSGLVAEGTIQFNPSTKACSIVKFSIKQGRHDSNNTFSKLYDKYKAFRDDSTTIDQVHFEKKRGGGRNVQNFVSSVWGSEKQKMERQMSKEGMYSNFFLDCNRTVSKHNFYKFTSINEYTFSDGKHFQRRTDTHPEKNNDDMSAELCKIRSKEVTSENSPNIDERETSLNKTESYLQTPKETDNKEKLRVPENTKSDKPNKPQTFSRDSLEKREYMESDENWDLKKFMDPFDEKYPDLITEESLYECILIHGENERTKRMFENVVMFADSNGFEMKDSSTTGNCMFQSINDQLQINGDFRFDLYSLRHLAVKYLEEHSTDSGGTHLESFIDEQWTTYLTRMAQPYEWGDHLVLKALCEVLQRNIFVINVQYDDKTSHHEIIPLSRDQYRAETLYLGHIGEFHYVSLRPKLWKQTWISAAVRNNRLDQKNDEHQHPNRSSIENYLVSNLSEIDPISQVPVPYMTFAMAQITERSEICCLQIPSKLVPVKGFGIATAGGRSDGTEVFIMYKDKIKHTEEYWHRYSYESPLMILYPKNSIHKVICDGEVAPLPYEQIRAEIGETHPGYCTLRYYGKEEVMLTTNEVTVVSGPEYPGRTLKAYHCSTWPVCAKEWLTRKSEWPKVDLKEKISSLGCLIAKRTHAHSRAPIYEWQFIFNDAEKMLVKEALTTTQLYVYRVFKSCLDYHSNYLQYRLGTVHVKSTFFYVCEMINDDKFEASPGVCFLYLAGVLLRGLKKRNIPNYFIKENNMIDHFKDEDIQKLIHVLEAIRYFPLQCLGFMMDERGYHRSGIIDIIQKDSEAYRRHMDISKAFCHVFFPLTIRQARRFAKSKKYRKAYEKIRDARLLLVLAPLESGKPVFVPGLDNLLEQTLKAFDRKTVDLVNREMEESKSVRKVMDLTDGKDVGGFGEVHIPSHIAGNSYKEATLLNSYGVILHNIDHDYEDASTYYASALDRLESAFTEADVHEGDRNINPEKYTSEQYDHDDLALTIFKNVFHTRVLEKLKPRMSYLEKICIRMKNTEHVDFVMEAWERLGHPDRAEKFHSLFLEHFIHKTQ